jgi:hypothetical protein
MILQSNGNHVQLHGMPPSMHALSLIEIQLISDVEPQPAESPQPV